jgi:hypothetical protein
VHYVRFRVGREGRQLLASRETAALEVDHAGYRARQTLPPETVEELLRDLSD